MSPAEIDIFVAAGIKLAAAIAEYQATTDPILKRTSSIVENMQAEGRETPTPGERQVLKDDAQTTDTRAQDAIDQARERGE